MNNTISYFVLALFFFAASSIYGCSTTTSLPTTSHKYTYKKIEVSGDTIREVVSPGMSVSVYTKDIVLRCIVTGYDEANKLICLDKYNKEEEKVFIDDIQEIRVEVKEKESGELPERKLVTYAYGEDVFKQILVSIVQYPKIVFSPVRTKQELIITKSKAEEELEYYIEENYYNIEEEALSSCGKYIDTLYGLYLATIEAEYSSHIKAYPYIAGTYDDLTEEIFCVVLQDDSGILFGFNDLFLSTLKQRIHAVINPSDFSPYQDYMNSCKNITRIMKEKEEENIESFTVACSDETKEFQCDFQGKIAYDGKGIPYKKARLMHMVSGLIVYSYKVQPACWSSGTSSIVRRLAVQNGCEDVGKVTKIKQEGYVETFAVICSDGIKEFQCDFQGEISVAEFGYPVKKVYGKSYTSQPACWSL